MNGSPPEYGRPQLPAGSRGWTIPHGMTPLRLPAQFGLAVVGEAAHQTALRRAAGGRSVDISGGRFENAIPVKAALVPEPGNPDEPHAVAVTVGDELVGYLPSSAAEAWQPVLLRAWETGRYVVCAGSISGGGPRRSYGIFLTVCHPIEVDFVAGAPASMWPVIGSATVTVVGEEEHPQALAAITPHKGTAATLHWAPSQAAASKAAGSRAVGSGAVGSAARQTIEVRIAGNRVGELTTAMTRRYGHLLTSAESRGLTLACRAHVSEDHRGKQVTISLPTEDELGRD